jgi:hypothetical protein
MLHPVEQRQQKPGDDRDRAGRRHGTERFSHMDRPG